MNVIARAFQACRFDQPEGVLDLAAVGDLTVAIIQFLGDDPFEFLVGQDVGAAHAAIVRHDHRDTGRRVTQLVVLSHDVEHEPCRIGLRLLGLVGLGLGLGLFDRRFDLQPINVGHQPTPLTHLQAFRDLASIFAFGIDRCPLTQQG